MIAAVAVSDKGGKERDEPQSKALNSLADVRFEPHLWPQALGMTKSSNDQKTVFCSQGGWVHFM